METGTETEVEGGVRRSDRWAAGGIERRRNWWAIVGVLVALAGYAVAATVVAIVTGDVNAGDDASLALVGAVPALAALGVTLGIIGARRDRLRWLAWIAVALGGVLVIASIAAIVVLTLAFRSFS